MALKRRRIALAFAAAALAGEAGTDRVASALASLLPERCIIFACNDREIA
jgi:hypothetical protein